MAKRKSRVDVNKAVQNTIRAERKAQKEHRKVESGKSKSRVSVNKAVQKLRKAEAKETRKKRGS